MKKINFILFYLIIFQSFSIAQKNTIKVKGIKGTSIINDRITPKQAKEEALTDALRNALKSAGVEEQIQSNMLLLKSSYNDLNSQYFSKEVSTQIQGDIIDYEITDTNITSDLVVTLVINATVIKYTTKPDINFDVKLIGVKNVYNNNDTLHFSLIPSIDCYLNIFSFIEEEATLVYPNNEEGERDNFLKKDTKITLPRGNTYQLSAENKKNEQGFLIFVFTKKQINFFQKDEKQKTTFQNIYKWINSIPLDQKKVITSPILIQF